MDREISQIYLLPKLLKKDTSKAVPTGVPTACRESFLLEDDKRIYNEHKNWAQDLQEDAPIWSRSKCFNCVGQQRQASGSKDNHYDIEIPDRLLSLWGSIGLHTEIAEKMDKFLGYQMVNNVLALCACLKYNLDRWSPLILDDIVRMGSKVYTELLRKSCISNNNFHITQLNSVYELDDSQFRVQLHQVALGVLYMPYGLNEFNLARALMWFFKFYQFGFLKCHERCVAFGFAVDIDMGYFLYDCQSSGLPVFKANATSSFILRTNHLQILLYCMVVTLGVVSDNQKFIIYNVDVQMQDAKQDAPSTKANKSKINPSNRLSKKLEPMQRQKRLHAGTDDENRETQRKSKYAKAHRKHFEIADW